MIFFNFNNFLDNTDYHENVKDNVNVCGIFIFLMNISF